MEVISSNLRSRFAFASAPVDGGDAEALRGAIHEVEEIATGVERTLKLWRKTGTDLDADLRELWLHEMRQLQRVMSYSGARRLIVDVLELVEDDEHFGIVLEHVGQPLETRRRTAPRQHWLRNLGAPRARTLFWKNIRRLAEALGIIHGQGLVHGSLSTATVMTDGADEPDFLLSGFEWSIRVGVDGVAGPRLGPAGEARRAECYSFAEDWRALGVLVAQCLGVELLPSGEVVQASSNESASTALPERILIRRLAQPTRLDVLSAPSVLHAIDDLLATLANSASVRTGAFVLLLAEQSGIGPVVHGATGGAVDSDDWPRLLEWVRSDLATGARLLVPRGSETRLVATANAVYTLHPFRDDGGTAWDIAVCKHVRTREKGPVLDRAEDHVLSQPIVVVRGARNAREERDRRGVDVLDWGAFGQEAAPAITDAVDRVRMALLLVQCVEAVIKSLEVLPVEVVRREVADGRANVALRAIPASRNPRDELAKQMGVADTAETLRRLFEEDDRDSDRRWRLGQATSLGSSAARDVTLAFLDVVDRGGAYLFEVEGDPPDARSLFLRPEGEGGTENVIRRRLRHIAALETRADLAEVLDNPWMQRRASREVLDEGDAHFADLDGPKRDAMRLLWRTLPSIFVVGPPGVGKTRLATEVVRRRFKHEPSARMLVCAQGHDALEHLQQQLRKTLHESGMRDVLVVRSTTPEEHRTTDVEIPRVVDRCLQRLAESPMLRDAPPHLVERVRELAKASAANESAASAADLAERAGLGALASLVLDGANVVISTANSGDVERLVEDRAQFDWVLVEEAAKATGPELVGPMMLAGRHLLIGDHNQLPPFDSERLARVLGNQSIVRDAVAAAEDRIRPLLADDDLDDLETLRADPGALASTANLALRLLQPFRTFVEDDERRRVDGRPPIAATLTEQRRMDPAIARIVSHAFYNDALTTERGRAEGGRSTPSPILRRDPLPESPVVVVSFPHVSATGRAAPAESSRPRWQNVSEARAVVDVLRHVRPAPGCRPSLAVLSPYAAQVALLRSEIRRARRDLAHLAGFARARDGGELVGTVDAFQGSEADLVIVSLVRNNARAGASALGFLRDRRRMNVLLSRARLQLIIVGSLDFLHEAVRGVNPRNDPDHELAFLSKIRETIDALSGEMRDGVPLASIVHPELLRGGK